MLPAGPCVTFAIFAKTFWSMNARDIDDSVDKLRSAGEVVSLLWCVGLKPNEEVLRIIPTSACDGRSPFDGAGGDVVIGIALVQARRIVHQYRVHLQRSEQKHQARTNLDDRPGIHVVVRIIQEDRVLASEPLADLDRVALVL